MKVTIQGQKHEAKLRYSASHASWILDVGAVALRPEDAARLPLKLEPENETERRDLMGTGFGPALN